MDIQTVKLMNRFYYSLLVSVRLYKKYTPVMTVHGQKNHVARWLHTARSKQLFNKGVLMDIVWLTEQNRLMHPDALESQLQKIYLNARLICLTAGVCYDARANR